MTLRFRRQSGATTGALYVAGLGSLLMLAALMGSEATDRMQRVERPADRIRDNFLLGQRIRNSRPYTNAELVAECAINNDTYMSEDQATGQQDTGSTLEILVEEGCGRFVTPLLQRVVAPIEGTLQGVIGGDDGDPN